MSEFSFASYITSVSTITCNFEAYNKFSLLEDFFCFDLNQLSIDLKIVSSSKSPRVDLPSRLRGKKNPKAYA